MSELENLVVVLVRTRNPLNLGAVARAMSNFGAAELRAVEPYGKAWREARSAVGAGEVMAAAKEFATIAEAVADCSLVVGTTSVGNRELKHPLHDLVEATPLLRERMKTRRVAVLFGSEKCGLSNEELSFCHWLLRIPTREEHRSMNLGQAMAVVLYELGRKGEKGEGGKGFGGAGGAIARATENKEELNAEAPFAKYGQGQRRERREERKRRKVVAERVGGEEDEIVRASSSDALKMTTGGEIATREKEEADMKASATGEKEERKEFAEMGVVERIGEALLEVLVKSEYVGPRRTELAEEKLRRMLRRFSMEAADAEVFLGMVRKIVEKMK
jgi:TrmH family RNA methyltransferase